MLLSGSIPPPEWAQPLIQTLENCTGMPGNRRWVDELNARSGDNYVFGGIESPRDENGSSGAHRPSMGSRKNSYGNYFDFNDSPDQSSPRQHSSTYPSTSSHDLDEPGTDYFETKFESDFVPNEQPRRNSRLSTSSSSPRPGDYPFKSVGSNSGTHKRSVSAYTPTTSSRFSRNNSRNNPFEDDAGYGTRSPINYEHEVDEDRDVFGAPIRNAARGIRGSSPPPAPKLTPKTELSRPLQPHEGVARAIALFDFNAVQVRSIPSITRQLMTHENGLSPEISPSRRAKSSLLQK